MDSGITKDGIYWEKRIVSWPANVTDDGDVYKTGPETIEDIIDSGTENLSGLDDAWQVMN